MSRLGLWLALAALVHVEDVATTHAGLLRGASEVNPLACYLYECGGPGLLLLGKLVVIGGMTAVMLWRCPRRWRAVWWLWRAGVVATTLVVVSNAVQVL